MNRRRADILRRAAPLLVGAVVALSCGSSESVAPPTRVAASADAGRPPVDGATSRQPPRPGTVQCGQEVCTPHQLPFGNMVFGPCCPAAAPTRCGVDVSFAAAMAGLSLQCMELEAPGKDDVSCRSLSMTGNATLTFPGCRTPSSSCGLRIALGDVNLGCVDMSRFRPMTAPAPPTGTGTTPGRMRLPTKKPPPRDKPGALSHRCCAAIAQSQGGVDPMRRAAVLQAYGTCKDLADRGLAKKKAISKVRAAIQPYTLPHECQ